MRLVISSCNPLSRNNLFWSQQEHRRHRVALHAQNSSEVQPPSKSRNFKRIEDDLPSDAEVVPLRPLSTSVALQKGSNGRFAGTHAVVAGATGGTGKAIVQRLVAEKVPVRALVRDLSKAASVLPGLAQGVELIKGDVYQFESIKPAFAESTVLLIATGSTPIFDPLGPYNTDYQGTVNLVTAAQRSGIKKIVLVSSIGVDDTFFPLNLFFGVLFWKKRGEEAVQRSGLDYTIIRPGGLLNEPRQGQPMGALVVGPADTFGLPPRRQPGSILRSQVADLCVESLVEPAASNKVVEAITDPRAVFRSYQELFASV